MAFSAPKTAMSAASVDSVGGNIYTQSHTGEPVSAIWIQVDVASANPALVNIPGLHKSDEFMPLAIGQSQAFALSASKLTAAFAKGNGGNATMSWGIISNR